LIAYVMGEGRVGTRNCHESCGLCSAAYFCMSAGHENGGRIRFLLPTFYDLSCCSTMCCPLTTWSATSNFSDRALNEFGIEGITTTITLHLRSLVVVPSPASLARWLMIDSSTTPPRQRPGSGTRPVRSAAATGLVGQPLAPHPAPRASPLSRNTRPGLSLHDIAQKECYHRKMLRERSWVIV
jgi:hypothetical protein